MPQSNDGSLGDRMVGGGILVTAIGAVLSVIGLTKGYWPSLVGILLSSGIGFVLMTVGAHKSGRSVWDAIKRLSNASKRQGDQWTPYKALSLEEVAPPTAVSINIIYQMWAADLNIPLKIKFSTEPDGYGIQTLGSGEAGEVNLMIDRRDFIYYSVSHPQIRVETRISGHIDAL